MLEKQTQVFLQEKFDQLCQSNEDMGVEFWFARDLMPLLGYSRWENFVQVVHKAMLSCSTASFNIDDHFRCITKAVEVGSGAKRDIEDVMLTRYACYLIAQNGDPRKRAIAFAQCYFAVQTRKQEIIEERLRLLERTEARDRLREAETQLSKNIYERGVDDKGFGRIRSKGDKALFGGFNTQQMKDRYGIKGARPLADFLPTLTIAAKNLAAEMTNYNVQQEDLYGESSITREHVQNNTGVREMLGKRNIKPEELPADEDIKKVERRVQAEVKKLGKQVGKLPEKLD